MRHPITKEYLDELRQKLIAAEERKDTNAADSARREYRQACAAASAIAAV